MTGDDELKPIPDFDEEEGGGPVKTFLEHLEDLRWVLIRCFAAVGLAVGVMMFAAPVIVDALKYPMAVAGITMGLEAFNPVGGVFISLKTALYGGVAFSVPFILMFVGLYVFPALHPHERTYFTRALTVGGGLFFLGMMLCYFWILPLSLQGLVAFNTWLGLPTTVWRAEEYFHFVLLFMVGMGIAFEIPVVLLSMVKFGVISHEMLVKGRVYFFVGNMVVCAFITPDAFSTIFMVVPVQILLEICILISKSWERKKRLLEARELALEREGPDSPSGV